MTSPLVYGHLVHSEVPTPSGPVRVAVNLYGPESDRVAERCVRALEREFGVAEHIEPDDAA